MISKTHGIRITVDQAVFHGTYPASFFLAQVVGAKILNKKVCELCYDLAKKKQWTLLAYTVAWPRNQQESRRCRFEVLLKQEYFLQYLDVSENSGTPQNHPF